MERTLFQGWHFMLTHPSQVSFHWRRPWKWFDFEGANRIFCTLSDRFFLSPVGAMSCECLLSKQSIFLKEKAQATTSSLGVIQFHFLILIIGPDAASDCKTIIG